MRAVQQVSTPAIRLMKADVIAPVRYLGFRDSAGARNFIFGRHPGREDALTYKVEFALTLFREHKMSYQEGPAMCARLIASNSEPRNYVVTDEMAREFGPVRPEKKPR